MQTWSEHVLSTSPFQYIYYHIEHNITNASYCGGHPRHHLSDFANTLPNVAPLEAHGQQLPLCASWAVGGSVPALYRSREIVL